MLLESPVNKKLTIARNFSRAASTYDENAILQQEIGARLLERLDLIKITPTLILDLGGGTGNISNALTKKFPKAQVVNLDIAEGMASYAKRSWHSAQLNLCADGEYCPIKDQSIDLVFSNCTFEWFFNPQKVLKEIQRILKPDGLLLFSTFGPDTLKELRQSFATLDEEEHVNPFLDMHDIGDILIRTGFLNPVMDMEIITLTYTNVMKLIKDLKLTGTQTLKTSKHRGFTSKNTWNKLSQAYESHRIEGILPATFEIIYGHAWVSRDPMLHRSDEEGIIRIPVEHLQYL